MCECEAWRRADRCHDIAAALVADGVVDTEDQADAAVSVARVLARWGCFGVQEVNEVRRRGLESWQRAAVDAYARVAMTTNDTSALANCIRELGVNPHTLSGWARKHYGPGYLASLRPVSGMSVIREALAKRPWQSRAELMRRCGVTPGTFSGAMHYALERGTMTRRRGDDGRWRYALPEASP